jgi:hypothetical protein
MAVPENAQGVAGAFFNTTIQIGAVIALSVQAGLTTSEAGGIYNWKASSMLLFSRYSNRSDVMTRERLLLVRVKLCRFRLAKIFPLHSCVALFALVAIAFPLMLRNVDLRPTDEARDHKEELLDEEKVKADGLSPA